MEKPVKKPKKIFFQLAFVWLAIFPAIAQAQDLIDILAKETCECLESKNFKATEDATKMKIDVGICVLEAYNRHDVEAKDELGLSTLDQESGRQLGTKIGFKMVNYCPELVMKMGLKVAEEEKASGPAVVTLSGKIHRMEEGDFISYFLKADDGKTYKLLWYKNFKGSEEFLENPKKLVGRNVQVAVAEVECYIPKAKGYYSVKEIVEIKF